MIGFSFQGLISGRLQFAGARLIVYGLSLYLSFLLCIIGCSMWMSCWYGYDRVIVYMVLSVCHEYQVLVGQVVFERLTPKDRDKKLFDT